MLINHPLPVEQPSALIERSVGAVERTVGAVNEPVVAVNEVALGSWTHSVTDVAEPGVVVEMSKAVDQPSVESVFPTSFSFFIYFEVHTFYTESCYGQLQPTNPRFYPCSTTIVSVCGE